MFQRRRFARARNVLRRFVRRRFPRLRRRRVNKNYQGSMTRPGKIVRRVAGVPFPQRFDAKLKFTSTKNLNGGAIATQLISATDMNDPLRLNTGTITRPMYYNQFRDLYDAYIVNGSKIVAKFDNLQVSTPLDLICFVCPLNLGQTLSGTSLNQISSQPFCKYKMTGGLSSTGNQPKIIRYYMSTRKFNGGIGKSNSGVIDPTSTGADDVQTLWRVFADSSTAGTLANTPQSSPHWNWQIGMMDPANVSNIDGVCVYTITYYVTFIKRDFATNSTATVV